MRARPFVATGLFRVDAAPAAANQYVFVADGTDLYAYLYNDDQYVSTRGSIPYSSFTTVDNVGGASVIFSDSSAVVGDGSLMGTAHDGVNGYIYVWDVDGGALYTWTAGADEKITTPVYYSGKVYITCADRATNEIVVYRGNTDLTSVVEWQREAFTTSGASGLYAGASSTALFVEVDGEERHRFTFAGVHTGPHDISAETNNMARRGSPRSDGKMVYMDGTPRLCVIDDAYDSAITTVWPAWGDVSLDNVSVNASGTKAQASGATTYEMVRDATSGSFGGSPAIRTASLEDSPDGVLYGGGDTSSVHYFGD